LAEYPGKVSHKGELGQLWVLGPGFGWKAHLTPRANRKGTARKTGLTFPGGIYLLKRVFSSSFHTRGVSISTKGALLTPRLEGIFGVLETPGFGEQKAS